MLRETNKVIMVDKVIKEEVILNQEEITKYTIDKKNKNITVEINLTGDSTGLVETETHRFFSNDFIDGPTELELWNLIDRKRSDL